MSSEVDILIKFLETLKASSQNSSSSSTIINELSDRLNSAKTELGSREVQLRQVGAIDAVYPDETNNEFEEVPAEVRSPRSRPKTWPEHRKLVTQFKEKLEKFDEWLNTTEQNLLNFTGITIPQTLNEMKLHLKEIQVRNLSCC